MWVRCLIAYVQPEKESSKESRKESRNTTRHLGEWKQEVSLPVKRSKNALKHGLHARDAVLEWESESEFTYLYESIREEFHPDGALEEETIFDLTMLHWKKRRLNVASQLGYHRQPDARAMAEAGSGGWPGVT